MKFTRIKPNKLLVPYVESFWTVESNIEEKDYLDFKEFSFFVKSLIQIGLRYLITPIISGTAGLMAHYRAN